MDQVYHRGRRGSVKYLTGIRPAAEPALVERMGGDDEGGKDLEAKR